MNTSNKSTTSHGNSKLHMPQQLSVGPEDTETGAVNKHFVILGISLLALTTGSSACAAGLVHAVAGAASDIKNGPLANSASADDGLRFAITTRISTSVLGSVANNFTDQSTPMQSRASSDFTVVGLVGTVPLTFHWGFSGSRTWDVNNASFGGSLNAGLDGPGFITNVDWGISYVDAPANQGDFAGILTNSFSSNSAGANFAIAFDPTTWSGQGTRTATTTILAATSGMAGTYSLLSDVGFSGDVTASYGSELTRVTVQDASQLLPGAHLLMDNGSQFAITAIPEPSTFAMFAMVSLVAAGQCTLFRRR